jgi:hypothetical protein
MADHSLPPRPSYVLITLAQREARQAVKEQLRGQGLKPQYMRTSEINRAADLYLKEHARDLLEVAWKKCQGCPDLMKLYEKEQRDRQRKTVNILLKCDHFSLRAVRLVNDHAPNQPGQRHCYATSQETKH